MKKRPDDVDPQDEVRARSTDPGADPLGLESLWQLVEGDADRLPPDPLVGMTICGVTLSRLIAEGGMGRVYKGLQDSPRRTVAVKVLRPGLLARSAIRRFVQETQILARLRHPWITQVFFAGTFEIVGSQLPFFVMEYIPEALPITEYVRVRGLPIRERLGLFCQVCDAVAHAHANGFTHRDLKPSNVLVDSAGHPKVIDFGIARETAAAFDPITMTSTGQMLGTLQYMSPEQVDGGPIDARADVYSLGIILHELVTGVPPYDLANEPVLEAARIIRERPAPTISACDADVPPGIALVIDTALQKNPARRHADAAALAAEVRSPPSAGGLANKFSTRVSLLFNASRRSPRTPWVSAALAMLAAFLVVIMLNPPSVFRTTAAGIGTGVVPPSLASASVAFRHSFSGVLDESADRYLVEASAMRKWDDPREEPRVTYWGPTSDGVEGRLVYRFLFPGRSARIRIDADSQCWDFLKHPGGFGRGVSSVEASRDGTVWLTLRDNITNRNWGASWDIHKELSPELLGTEELWLRLRFLTESAEHDRGYTVAQFARGVTGRDHAVFAIEADCVPPDESR